MEYQSCLINAIETVLAWDIPDEAFSAAVKAQACLMGGIEPEEIRGVYSD